MPNRNAVKNAMCNEHLSDSFIQGQVSTSTPIKVKKKKTKKKTPLGTGRKTTGR